MQERERRDERSQEDSREQEEQYRLLVENLKDYAVFTMDADGLISSWNPGAEETLGYGEAEILGQPVAILFAPEDRERNVPQRELEKAGDVGRAEDNRWHVRKDGERIWVNGLTVALFDQGMAGQLRGFAKIMRDETRRLAQEAQLQAAHNDLERRVQERTEALHRSEERFSKAFHASPAPTMIVRIDDDRIFNVNESFLLQTDYERDEVVGRSVETLALYVDRPGREQVIEHLRQGVPVPLREMEIRKKGGEVLSVMVASEIIDIEDEACQLDIFIDITGRKQTEEQLMQAIQEVMSDTAWFSRSVMEKLAQLRSGNADRSEVDELTARERQVLSHMARGLSNETIAADLELAPQTVRNYISSIYLKLGVHTRAEAIVWARERGLG